MVTFPISVIDRLAYKWININRQYLISSVDKHMGISAALVLDLGCGRWPYTASFPNNKSSCRLFLALDISRETIIGAKVRSPTNFNFIVADARHIPLRDLAFDLVFSKDLLHHVQQQKEVLAEISRICRRAILIEANRPNKVNMLYTHLHGDQHLTLQDLMGLVSDSNFRILAVRQFNCYPASGFFHLTHFITVLINVMSLFAMILMWLAPKEALDRIIIALGSLLRTPSFNCVEVCSFINQ